MKFSGKTISILKNFSVINPSLMFRKGNVLTTISPQMTIMAKAKIDDEIEADFGIFELNRFLSVLSLFNDPQLQLQDSFMKITDGKKSVNYIFADPENMILPPNREMKTMQDHFKFELSVEHQTALMKAAGVLQLPELAIVGDGENVYYKAVDTKNPSNNSFEIKVGETDKTFNVIFKSDNMKIMNENYTVSLSKGIAHFHSPCVEYWIANESNSKFGD